MKQQDFQTGTWLNKPATSRLSEGELTITTDANTDFWRDTYYGFRRDSGHFLGFETAGDFTAEVRLRGHFQQLYDQAGLLVRIDETVWCKAGVEYNDGVICPGAVVTREQSDWSVSQIDLDYTDFWLRVTVAKGALQVRISQDRTLWHLLRLSPFPVADRYLVGPMCCTPERAGLEVTFSNLAIGPALTQGLHDQS